MKGTTARKILRIYRIVGVVLAVLIIGGGGVTLAIAAFVQNWKFSTIFAACIVVLFGIAWLNIEAEIDKNKPD